MTGWKGRPATPSGPRLIEGHSKRQRTLRANRPLEDGSRVVENKLPNSAEGLRRSTEREHNALTVARQCEPVGLARSTCYYHPAGESADNLAFMQWIDEQYLRTSFYGSRKMAEVLGIIR